MPCLLKAELISSLPFVLFTSSGKRRPGQKGENLFKVCQDAAGNITCNLAKKKSGEHFTMRKILSLVFKLLIR